MKEKTIKKYSAKWCGPCVAFNPVWEQLKKENPDWNFVEIDIDEKSGQELAVKDNVTAIPTFISSNGRSRSGTAGLTKQVFKEELLTE